MPYRRFCIMLEAGIEDEAKREAKATLAMIEAASFPHIEDKAARDRIIKSLVRAAGEGETERTAEDDLAAIEKLRMLFPTPPPDVLAEIERAKAEYKAQQETRQ